MLAATVLVFVLLATWQFLSARRSARRNAGRDEFVSDRNAVVVGFSAWALGAFLAAAASLTILSIGLLLAPLAAVAIWIAARFSPSPSTLSGALVGVGLFIVSVGVAGGTARHDRATWWLAGGFCVIVGIASGFLFRGRQGSPST